MPFATESALMGHAQKLENVTLGYLDSSLLDVMPSMKTKGVIGRTIETYFGVRANAKQEPDFPHLGIELKVAPIRNTANGWSAKERISITVINYEDVADTSYELSHLADKTRAILMVFYEYKKHTTIGNFRIVVTTLWHPTPYEENALRHVYAHVRQSVNDGTAHLLSASDTTYFETATKGSGENLIPQPNSAELAKRRAFCLKTSGVTQIVRDVLQGVQGHHDEGPSSVDEIDEYLKRMTQPRIGKRLAEIQSIVAPETELHEGKSRTSSIALRMLGAPPNTATVPLLERRGLTVRTCRVDEATLRPYEATSLPRMRYDEVEDMTWETSPERDLLTDMVFIVFASPKDPKEERSSNLRLLGVVRWRPQPAEDRRMGSEWEDLMGHVISGDMEGRAGAGETEFLHIRPHARDAEDTGTLPNGREFVNSSFWLNQSWLQSLFVRELGAP